MTDATPINSEPTPRILGLARNVDEIADRMMERKNSLGLSDMLCDELGGLSAGHTSKVLSASRKKGLGRFTIDTLAQVLGISFLIIEDEEKIRRIEGRYEKRIADRVRVRTVRLSSAAMAQAKIEIYRNLGRLGAAARNSALSAEKKSMLGRRAAKAKHRKRRALVEAA
jgi:hypothetical protein